MTAIEISGPRVRESTTDELATQRYLLDLALQPVDSFDGFTRLEQIGGSALRYQLNSVGYALAVSQYTRTPAFTGYVADAQANMIRKMCDKRVWGYWATERLAGYLRWDPDPMVYGNVMYTGFFAAMLAFYETLNADRGFDADGSLPLVWSESRRFDYGYGSIATAIEHNMRRSKHTMYPCEPHLIYPMCNAVALVGLKGFDRLHGTDLTSDLVDKTADALDRFGYITDKGRFRFGRGPFGVKLPPMVANDAVMTYWLNGILPDLAQQAWATLRRDRIRISGSTVHLKTEPIDHLDVGSYKMGNGWAWVNVLCAAREMGDTETADAVADTIERKFRIETSPSGARKMAGVSAWVSLAHALSQLMTEDAFRGLATGDLPEVWRTGPILSGADYPDVLVAKAVTDGQNLDLVLQPGNGPASTTLRFSRLSTSDYTVIQDGEKLSPLRVGSDGTANLPLRIDRRTEVRIEQLAVNRTSSA